MTKPIRPEDVKQPDIPDGVIEVFNEMIEKHWDGRGSTLYQDTVAKAVASRMATSTREVYDNRWLDVETLYRDAGWKVIYNSPGYNEDFEAYFVFSRKGK